MLTVTAAILIQDNRVFIGQRKADKWLANLWEFPGGKVERGETPEDCLLREMREELGIDVVVGELFGESVYHYSYGSIRLLAYLVHWTSGEMSLIDHQDCRWVAFGDLERYEFVPADIPFVERLQSDYQDS